MCAHSSKRESRTIEADLAADRAKYQSPISQYVDDTRRRRAAGPRATRPLCALIQANGNPALSRRIWRPIALNISLRSRNTSMILGDAGLLDQGRRVRYVRSFKQTGIPHYRGGFGGRSR